MNARLVDSFGVIPRTRAIEFAAHFARNGSMAPLPEDRAECQVELLRRAKRVAPELAPLFGLADADDVANHVALLQLLFGTIPVESSSLKPAFAVLEPFEFRCTACTDGPYLTTIEDAPFGPPSFNGQRPPDGCCLRVLTANGVLDGAAYYRSCPRCQRSYFYDRITRLPTTQELQAGAQPNERIAECVASPASFAPCHRDALSPCIVRALRSPYVQHAPPCRFRPEAWQLPYTRVSAKSQYAIETHLLLEHHAANERLQESADGAVDARSVVHHMMESDGVWCSAKRARTEFDKAYFKWFIIRRHAKIAEHFRATGRPTTFQVVTPHEFQSQEAIANLYLRTATIMTELGICRWAQEHDLIEIILDDCNIVISDGNHKVKWACCMFDDILYQEIPDVCQIPYGCQGNRMMQTDACKYHFKYVGMRTPQSDDGASGHRIVKDACRADALALARERIRSRPDLAPPRAGKCTEQLTAREIAQALTAMAGTSEPASAAAPPEAPPLRPAAARARKRGINATRQRDDADETHRGVDVDEEAAEAGEKKHKSSKLERAVAVVTRRRSDRSEAFAKLQAHRTMQDVVVQVNKATMARDQQRSSMDDESRLLDTFGGLLDSDEYLEPAKRAWYGLGDDAYLVEKITGKKTVGMTQYHAVKFVGWQKVTWEPSHAKLQAAHVKAFEEAVAAGASEVNILPVDEAMKPNASLPEDLITMPMTQWAESLAKSRCGVLKTEQAGEPKAGYLRTTAGVIAHTSACRRILMMDVMRNSETTTQTLYGLFKLKRCAPAYGARLKGFASDMACKIKLHVRAKVRDLPADSPARPYYEWLDNDIAMFVDNFHFGNHDDDDVFCQTTTNPELYPELSTDSNSEACEQTFTWWSRFKRMINPMANSKAVLFMEEMRELHNETTLRSDVMSVDFMPHARLAEVLAAYGFDACDTSTLARTKLVDFLLGQNNRPPELQRAWSPQALAAHRVCVGGKWRDVHERQKQGAKASASTKAAPCTDACTAAAPQR